MESMYFIDMGRTHTHNNKIMSQSCVMTNRRTAGLCPVRLDMSQPLNGQ